MLCSPSRCLPPPCLPPLYQAEDHREGPVGLNEMKDLHEQGIITRDTKCWAQGMEGWQRARDVPQLKWTLCAVGGQILNPTELAALILDTFTCVCEFSPSRDGDALVRPLPRVKQVDRCGARFAPCHATGWPPFGRHAVARRVQGLGRGLPGPAP